jgi:GxxExxY protein
MTFPIADALSQLTHRILGSAITVHRALGPGLLESAYQACFEYELHQTGIPFRRQVALPVHYHDVKIECGYRVDLIVADQVIVELKAVETLTRVHQAQMITYLRLTGCPVGLLLNFNVASMRHGIRRIGNHRPTKPQAHTSGDPLIDLVRDRDTLPDASADRRSACVAAFPKFASIEDAPP